MRPARVGRPRSDEHLPYYGQYIALVPEGDILDILEWQLAATLEVVNTLDPEQATRRPAPAEWSPIEYIGHLADTERVFAYRALRIARTDPLPWASAELEIYVDAAGFRQRPLAEVAAEFAAVRAATLALLRGLDAAAWRRLAPDDWTTRSVRAIAYILAGHELHHLPDLRGKHADAAA